MVPSPGFIDSSCEVSAREQGRCFRQNRRRRTFTPQCLVQPGELCVCDLVAILQLPRPTISRHLSYLRRAGLVKARQDRTWNYYALTPSRSAFHTKLLECLGTCFRDVPELAADATRARAIRKKGGCCPT